MPCPEEQQSGVQETGSLVPTGGRGFSEGATLLLAPVRTRSVGALLWNMAARSLWAVQRLQRLLASGAVSESR